MSEENVEIVRRIYDAVARRDATAVLALHDPEVEMDGSRHRWAELMGTSSFRGHEGLRRWSREYYEMWENLDHSIEELIDAGEHVVSIVTSRGQGRASGIEVEWKHHAGVWTIRDGKVVRVAWFRTRAEALAAAGLSE
jgi:ketosteroid isomerase-like protein